MKVIFIGLEGLLTFYRGYNPTVHPSTVESLNHILRSTQAVVVLVGGTTIFGDLDGIKEFFSDQGLLDCIIDVAPNLHDGRHPRTRDIESYVELHKKEIESFVVIDNEVLANYMFHDKLVRPSRRTFLTKKQIDSAVKILETAP